MFDATVLNYLVGQDEDCQILTVGSWFAMSTSSHITYNQFHYTSMDLCFQVATVSPFPEDPNTYLSLIKN